MFWYKKQHIKLFKTVLASLIISTVLFSSCSNAPDSSQNNSLQNKEYFDIKTYFEKEIEKLNEEKPLIKKTVLKDSEEETKDIEIKDWETELNAFLSVDLQKPVYSEQFSIKKEGNFEIYTTKDPKLDLQFIKITKENGQVSRIVIHKKVGNMLYKTTEKLEYKENGFYTIEKEQNIRILGTNNYVIKGSFE